jgi:squalene synthase HpnC
VAFLLIMAQRVTCEFIDRAEEMAERGCTLSEADALCRDLTARHYENFPVLSRLLPEPQRGALCAVYAFARLADDFADEARHAGERGHMLGLWRERLFEAAGGDHPHPVFKSLGAVMDRHQISPQLLARLVDAFEQDTRVNRYETWDDLLDYCRRSADPVGRTVLRIFGHDDEAMDHQSDAICTALQLTNHWQDVGEDLARDRIYIPREEMRRFGVTEEMLFDRVATPSFEEMMRECVRRAWRLFDRGRPLAWKVDRPLARWVRLVWLGGTAILRRIEDQGFDTLTRRPRLTRADKVGLALRGLIGRRLPEVPIP